MLLTEMITGMLAQGWRVQPDLPLLIKLSVVTQLYKEIIIKYLLYHRLIIVQTITTLK